MPTTEESLKPVLRVMNYRPESKESSKSWRIQLEKSPHDWSVVEEGCFSEVGMQRSIDATEFLLKTEGNVLVFKDHDVVVNFGGLDYLAEKAYELKAIVGAVVCKRQRGQGWGFRDITGTAMEIASGQVFELGEDSYMGGALMAIHRSVFEAMLKTGRFPMTWQKHFPFFVQCLKTNKQFSENVVEHLTEDWSFCHHAREAGCKVYVAMKPLTGHEGSALYGPLQGQAY